MNLRLRRRAALEEARLLAARLVDERDQARRERDDALAGLSYAQDTILALHAESIANDPGLWQAIAERAADEAEAYSRQLVDAGLVPNRDYRQATAP